MTDIKRIGEIRTAATWLRTTSRMLDEYPRRKYLDATMRWEATAFASGRLPWPSRWTQRLYELATAG